ncbi:MAG: Ig-like domain-containing protein [Spirochaetales bacterium]|nr:Ig-like domain-containing protein [Spirochaetales bacterium]MCF7938285.1 Ig-like domain-containing protein [Spirochaetales bacterium]
MVQKQRSLFLLFILLPVFFLASCFSVTPPLIFFGDSGNDAQASAKSSAPEPVTLKEINISWNGYCISIPKGESLQLEFETRPESSEQLPYTWKSFDSDTVRVDKDGKITGLEYGMARISVSLPAEYNYYENIDEPLTDKATVLVYNDTNLQRIDPPEIQEMAHFGEKIALSAEGKTLLISSPGIDKAYLYELEGGGFTLKKSLAGRAEWSGGFAEAVSLSADGRRAAVGSLGDKYSGAVYLYAKKDGEWIRERIVEGPPVEGRKVKNYFGWAVALNNAGDELWVSAPYEAGPGRIHIYRLKEGTWSETGVLKPETGKGNTKYMFGYSMDISADGLFAVVGVPSAVSGISNNTSGRVYTYEKKDGLWVKTYHNGFVDPVVKRSIRYPDHRYGHSVAAIGDNSLFFSGIPKLGRGHAGGVEVFDRRSGPGLLTLDRKFVHQKLGQSVSASEDGRWLLAGAGAFGGEGAGLLYHHKKDGTWNLFMGSIFITPAGEKENWPSLGKSTALSADAAVAVVGAPDDDTRVRDAGCVYYRLIQD